MQELDQIVGVLEQQAVDPITYRYFKCLSKREILLNDYVDETIIERVVLPLIEMDNDGSGKEIKLFICSGGGSAYHGHLLVDVIERLKTPTKIYGMGLCMSMALLLLCAGKNNPNIRRYAYPSTVGLLHAGSINIGNSDVNQAKDILDFNNKYDKNITKQHILRNSTINEKDYAKYARKEKYMTADEMLELGFIDEIL